MGTKLETADTDKANLTTTAGPPLLGGCVGCFCVRPYRYVSFEGSDSFQVVERTWRPYTYEWTTWSVPTRYEVTRPEYTLEIRTGESPGPFFSIYAEDLEGIPLAVREPDVASWGLRVPTDAQEGSWPFEVLKSDGSIESEEIHYKIETTMMACGWDLP